MGANNVNLISLKAGDVIRMADGAIVKVAQNPGDGVWVFGYYLTSLDAEPAADAAEEAIFAQDIDEVLQHGA